MIAASKHTNEAAPAASRPPRRGWLRPSIATSTQQAGFVITLEVLLVMVIFVLPLMVGFVMLGRKLYTLFLNQREFLEQPYSRATVWDSSDPPKAIGPVIGYDHYEAPLVIFRDGDTQAGVVLA